MNASLPNWGPRPSKEFSELSKHDYLAGYSDGFYRYPAGAGHSAPNSCEAYRLGFQHGTDDTNFDYLAAARDVKTQARNLRLMRDDP